MMRTMEQKEERQRALKERNEEHWDDDDLTFAEIARMLKCSRGTARRLFRWEDGVKLLRTPGSHRPIVRVPRHVFDRVMRLSTILWKT